MLHKYRMDSEEEREVGLRGEQAKKASDLKAQQNIENMEELLLLEEVEEATKYLNQEEKEKEEQKMNEIIRAVGKQNDIELPEIERKKQEINDKLGKLFQDKFKKKSQEDKGSGGTLLLAAGENSLDALQDKIDFIGGSTDKLVENIFNKELIKSQGICDDCVEKIQVMIKTNIKRLYDPTQQIKDLQESLKKFKNLAELQTEQLAKFKKFA